MSIVIASPGRLKGLFVAYRAISLALIAAAGGFIGVGIEAAWGARGCCDGQVIADTFFRIPPKRSMRKAISFRFRPIESSNLEPISSTA